VLTIDKNKTYINLEKQLILHQIFLMKNLLFFLLLAIILPLNAQKTTFATPTPRQLQWHKMRYYAFTHFGPNTFTDVEWGHGTEKEEIFNPTQLDCRQWAKTFKDAGMEGIIITAKHHDGFCLWPSKFSKHTVRESTWRDGKGDVLRELSDACKEYGLKFGVYLSPWDRNHPDYGTEKYNQIFVDMLTEVLTNYGDIFEVWFDGACGEGPNGKKQVYNFPAFEAVVRKLQPNAVIFSDVGPDIRWVGNESGYAGETNWSTINNEGWYAGIPDKNLELQSGHPNGKTYQPTEVDVSIRPGWFYHKKEDDKVKSLEKLKEIYLNSVGRNSNLLLNVPPDPRGLINENDVASLMKLKGFVDETFGKNLNSKIKSIEVNGQSANNLIDNNLDTYWASKEGNKPVSIEINFRKKTTFSYVQLQEYVTLGQRVKAFHIEVWKNKQWVKIAEGTTIGNRRIMAFEPQKSQKVKIVIEDSLEKVVLSGISFF
jgi:alpha-L-fucosidase